ncbi:MAG TPA: FAD-binding protein [Burkholderiales bacterium]
MAEPLSRPLSAAELCEIMRGARAFDASRLDRILRVDEDRGLVEVQASVTWRSLAERLRPGDAQAGAARTTLPTVGESLAWNAAGPDGRPAVTHVESITLVTPEGELRRVSRVANAELFALAVGGHGLFGAPYSVTLRIESLARAVSDGAASPPKRMPRDALRLLVPPEALAGFLTAARQRCGEWRVAIEAEAVRATRAEAETFLRWARRDYAEVTLLLTRRGNLGSSLKAMQVRRELIDLAIAAGGAFHIACTPEATREQTEACYPQLRRFLAEKRRFDRHERLVNAWYRRQRALLLAEPERSSYNAP